MLEYEGAWTPELLVECLKIIVWPAIALLLSFKFKSSITYGIRTFFSKNAVTEVSASATGISAKFAAARQVADSKESTGNNSVRLPELISAESINRNLAKMTTDHSEELVRSIKFHIRAMDIPAEEQIDILVQDLAQCQCLIRYLGINKALFRSQYDLLGAMQSNSSFISALDANRFFSAIKSVALDVFGDWDLVRYLAYPVSCGLVDVDESGYILTTVGKSYMIFMNRNPQLIDELAKL